MYKQSICSLIVVAVLALTATQTQGSPYDRVAYWDSNYATSWAGDGIAVRDALQTAGYTVVNAAELKTWMDARIADGKPSVVIFCRDDAPITVVETQDANCTLRKYLNAGGKIVWYGDIPFYYQAKSDGTTTNWGDGGSAAILGFNAAGGTRDVNGQVIITEAGTRWGLTKPWTSSRPASATATDNLEILATDKNGAACGWVKHYVVGDTCRGFVRIDDHSGTTVSVEQLMAIAEYYDALNSAAAPVPENGETEILRDAVFSWTAGSSAATHDVYLGTNFDDVNDATTSDPRGVLVSQDQTDTAFDPEGLLEYGQTYYWRIDEVNDAPDYTVFKGEVWSFTTETYAYPITGVTAAASIEQSASPASNTVNGSGLDDLDQHGADLKTMWVTPGGLPVSIQYTFDKEYKLHELWVWNGNSELELLMGFGAKDVAIEYSIDGETWTALENAPQFAQGTGKATYTANTIVDFDEVTAKYVKLTVNTSWGPTGMVSLSEVRFFYTPVQAFEPDPADNATGIDLGATLNWRPGREATSHQVYFGVDADAVAAGTAAAKTVTDHSYTPASMDLETVYYWKVDEVGDAGTCAGDVWSFTTQEFLVVDDFESYDDDIDAETTIWHAWIDGVTDQASGSQVGYTDAPFAEQTIVHGGKQSMPLQYSNTSFAFSEAKQTFEDAQDWTASGIETLALYFAGATGNTGQLYVKINNTKVTYDGDAANLARGVWQAWNIDLSTVGNVGNVRSLTIGVEGSGATGILYIDDIRLYGRAPEFVTPVDPGTTNLAALYTLDGNAKDTSGKGNNGTVTGTEAWVEGMIGQAMQFDGSTTYVDCGSGASLNLTDAVTITAWIKMDFTAGDRKIAGNQDGTAGGYKIGLFTNNKVEFEVRNAANQSTLNRDTAGGTALEQGIWYHVAGVYSKEGVLRTYVYGSLDREMATTAVLGATAGTFKLGRAESATSYFWMGALDDVRVYNRVLSQEEILWIMGQTEPVAKPF